MKRHIVIGMFGLLVTGTLTQVDDAFKFKSVFASDSVDPTRQEVEIHPVPTPDQNHPQTPGTTDENLITPNLPPPAIDPEIVHEPPPNPNPEAVILPPKIDPKMAVQPRTLPGYPDNITGGTEKKGAEDMSEGRSNTPK